MIGDSSFHCGGNAKAFVYPAEVVIREVEGASGFVILQLLRERIGQASETPNRHADREILPFNVAGGNVTRIGPSITNLDYRFHHRRRRVTSSGIILPVITVYLYNLREVRLSREHIFDAPLVEVKPIGRQLEAVFSASRSRRSVKNW